MLLLLLACGDKENAYEGPSGSGVDIFCDKFSEAEQENVGDFDSTSSGRIEAQLIVNLPNPKDTSVIGNAKYTLENEQQGSGEQLDQANPLGIFKKTLGAGDWSISIVGGNDCTNDIIVQIEAGVLLDMCIPLYCPEDCTNGTDDDVDGLTDCDDEDCFDDSSCGN